MSEITPGSSAFNVPPDQDFDTITFQGSMQQVLQENVGKYVIVEFLIGTGSLTSRQGLLYYVGAQFLVLYDEFESRFVVCDIFSVKFVTFLDDRRNASCHAQSNIDDPASYADMPAKDTAAMTPSQAAYAHAMRRHPASTPY